MKRNSSSPICRLITATERDVSYTPYIRSVTRDLLTLKMVFGPVSPPGATGFLPILEKVPVRPLGPMKRCLVWSLRLCEAAQALALLPNVFD